MMPLALEDQTPVAPPSYHRAQARLGPALHIDALTLVNTLHLLTLCRLAVRLAHHRCPPPLPAGPGGAPRRNRGGTPPHQYACPTPARRSQGHDPCELGG